MHRTARVLMYGGVASIVLGLAKVHAVRHGYVLHGSGRLLWSAAYVALLCFGAYGAGLPDLVRDRRGALIAALGSSVSASVVISIIQLFGGSALLPRFVVLGGVVIAVPWFTFCSFLALGGRSRDEERNRVVIVGDVGEIEALRCDLTMAPEKAAQLVASVTTAAARPSPGHKPLVDAVLENRARVIVLARKAQMDEGIVDQAARLHEAGLRVRTLSAFYEEWLGKLPISELERASLMFDVGELHRARYGRLKRLFDASVSLVGCVVLGGIVPLVVLGNLVANRGPLFYRQERVGRSGELVSIMKFRTMERLRDGQPADDWTSEDDQRITRFGRILRKTHLDELPQVVNIVRGELSLVGPRPEQPRYVRELIGKLPFYDLRHLVRPGLTGWAQVKFGYAGSEADALEKLQYDFFYLRHQGFAFDLRIIGRTIRAVVRGDGR